MSRGEQETGIVAYSRSSEMCLMFFDCDFLTKHKAMEWESNNIRGTRISKH